MASRVSPHWSEQIAGYIQSANSHSVDGCILSDHERILFQKIETLC